MRRTAYIRETVTLSVAETGDGQPFVFQHGLCGDAAQPEQVFPGDVGYRCVTVECRGHGQSEAGPKDNLSIATFADDLIGYLRQSGLSNIVLGGISMGAAISLRIAVMAPDLVRALVIGRPAWLDRPGPANMHANAFVGELLATFPPVEARQRFEASDIVTDLKSAGPDNLASSRSFFTREPIDVTSTLLRNISADGPGVTEQQIREIAVPTLVIGTGRDVVHPIAYARTLADWIPHARLIEITSKAESQDAYRADFRAALTAFLKEL